MFTGIIESLGEVRSKSLLDGQIQYWISCDFANELKVGDSLSHNGMCLTVTDILPDTYNVTLIGTTLNTGDGWWTAGEKINLERAMRADGRFDGHIVQGHIDTKGRVDSIRHTEGSVLLRTSFEAKYNNLIVDKGSICLHGVSFTITRAFEGAAEVAIIPHTWQVTNLNNLKEGDLINIEFDILGKYINNILKSGKL